MGQLALAGVTAQHTAESSEWYTPPEIVEPARALLDGIDLDPASCAAANSTVGASIFHHEAIGAPDHRGWLHARNIFLNPPSPARPWWEALMRWHRATLMPAVYVAYSIEQLSQSQGWSDAMLDWPTCIIRGRTHFLTPVRERLKAMDKVRTRRAFKPSELAAYRALQARDPDELVDAGQPAHSSAIVGVGIEGSGGMSGAERFAAAFGDLGQIVRAQ